MSNWLIDIDSTTMDTTGRQLELANEKFGLNLSLDDIVAWHWEDYMPPEVCEYVWDQEFYGNLEFHRVCQTVQDAVPSLHAIKDQGHALFFVSDRPDHLYEVTRGWLDSHGFEGERLIFSHRESLPKKVVARELELEMVVEDAPHHSRDLADQDFIRQVFLLDMPYNRDVPSCDKLTRVSGWTEIVSLVKEGK